MHVCTNVNAKCVYTSVRDLAPGVKLKYSRMVNAASVGSPASLSTSVIWYRFLKSNPVIDIQRAHTNPVYTYIQHIHIQYMAYL